MRFIRHIPYPFLIYIIPVLLLFQCTINDDVSQEYERWTSADPVTINHRIREQKYLLGNLVANSSFESGKRLEVDSFAQTTKIDGWDLIGKDVVWIHPDKDSVPTDSTEVHSGQCSIRIIRNNAGETEEFGQGVLSNFIKVIPGNYQLSVFLKLEDIRNLKSRLGTGIYDAVDIRILSYDRNKVQIDGDFYAPYYNTVIDNSFKGLSFSNFTLIDSTGWLHIQGRSHHFPFPEGDLQDEAKFVRIFIGLKGTGSMWIDDIQLNYTRWNFTLLERLSPYLDTTLSKDKLIAPIPRKVDIQESIIYYRPYYKDLFPVILISKSADGLTMQAARLIEEKIKNLLSELSDISKNEIPDLIKTEETFRENEASVIFSIGSTIEMKSKINNLPLESIKGKKKGYFIHTIDDLGYIIFLYGNTPEANYYAVQTASQLFDSKRLLFHNANIIDFPAGQDYGLLLMNTSELTLDFLKPQNETRFGYIYLPVNDQNLYTTLANEFSYTNYSRWLHLSYINDKSNLNYSAGFIDGIAILNTDFSIGVDIKSVIENFKEKQVNQSEIAFMNCSKIIQQAKDHNLDVELMPSFSNNISIAKSMFNPADIIECNILPKSDLPLIWSGYQYQSWNIDEADLMYFRQFNDEPIVFFDYSMLPRSHIMNFFGNDPAYPYKLLTSSLFEPFNNEVLPEVYQGVDKIIVVYKIDNVFDRIRLQTASDFFWNPDNYDPDLSLYRTIVSEFSDENAKRLVYFNDYYFKIRSDILLASAQKNPHKYQKRITSNFNEIKRILIELEKDSIDGKYQELYNTVKQLTLELENQLIDSELLVGVY